MADINDMTDQEAMDAATRAVWNGLSASVQADIEANMSDADRGEIQAAINRAKRNR